MGKIVSFRLSDTVEERLKAYMDQLNTVSSDEITLSDLIRRGVQMVIAEHEAVEKEIVNIKIPKKALCSQDLKDIWTILDQVETDATAEGFDQWQDVDAIRLIQESKNQLLNDIKRVESDDTTAEIYDLINKRKKEA